MANHLKADLDDMVFEDRERNYGAYFLRKRYPRNLSVSVGLVVFFALLGGFGPLVAKSMGWIKGEEKKAQTVVEIILTDLPKPPPVEPNIQPPPPRLPVEPIKQFDYRIPEPSPDVEETDTTTIHHIEDLVNQNLGFDDVEGEDEEIFFADIVDDGGPEVIIDTDPDPTEFVVTEEEPEPVNIKDVTKLIGYPQIAQEAGIQGRVLLRVLVDKNGQYRKHLITNTVHPILSEAVEKHISKLMFTPAIQGGRPIKFWVNIPFSFYLVN